MPLFFPALKDSLKKGYTRVDFRKDLSSGMIVGIVALPLGMALAIAVGLPPQHGLMTVIIAGVLASLFGGSKFNITGPTAAFVVVLSPIVSQYGLVGLLLAGMMAGVFLILMGLLRFGKYIHLIPYPVVVGFTSGIAVVIGLLQLKDFLGLQYAMSPEHTLEKVWVLIQNLDQSSGTTLLIGMSTLLVMIFWPKFKTPIPAHLVAILWGTGLSLCLSHYFGQNVMTLAQKFTYTLNGVQGHGIPPTFPHFELPWQIVSVQEISWSLIHKLIGPALVIALLGALESLLCAVVADRMTGTHHRPNAELIGQGIANVVCPFFGGIPATAAMARTATNVQAGAKSPISGVIHALFVLLSLVTLAPLLSYLPMSVLSALLLMTAWKMSEIHHFKRILTHAQINDKMVLLVCFLLTVVFDMVLAVSVGFALAGVLFLKNIIKNAEAHELENDELKGLNPSQGVHVFDLNGSLFFGAAQTMLESIRRKAQDQEVIILDFRDVRHIDFSGIIALETAFLEWQQRGIQIILCRVQESVQYELNRSGLMSHLDEIHYAMNLAEAVANAMHLGQGY